MRPPTRRVGLAVAAAAIVAALVVLAGWDGAVRGDRQPTAAVEPSPTAVVASSPGPGPSASIEPAPTPIPPAAESPAGPPSPVVRGFAFPIAGACLPAVESQLPNAPRDYRAGVHEGVDFYDGVACAAIVRGTPVLAAKAGLVIRADSEFVEMGIEELDARLARSQAQGYTDQESLDRFRGRQVWIAHEDGVVTRYAHLEGIAAGIASGAVVEAGQEVGYVGNSGTPEGVTDPNAELHLHFEIRVGDSYLGEGLPVDEVLALLAQVFSP